MGEGFREEMFDHPVTAFMQAKVTTVVETQTVAQAIASLRRDPPGERFFYLYVTNSQDQLVGVVPSAR